MTEELRIRITAETEELRRGVNEARQEVQDLSSKGKENFKKFSEQAKASADKVKAAMKIAGVAIAGAVTALVALGPATEEFRVNIAKLTAGFEAAGMTAEDAKGIYSDLFAVIGDSDQATEAANNIALLASSEKDAAKWAAMASGVVGTFHDTLQPEAFYEAANETLKLGEATGAYAQMLEQTGVMSVDKFNEELAKCKTEQEKQAFMLSVTEKAVGKAGESYNKSTEDLQKQRKAQIKMQESLSKIAVAIQPVITAFSELLSKGLEKIEPYITEFVEKYGPTIQDILKKVGDAIGTVISFIVDNWDVISTVATVIGAIAAAILIVNGAVTAYSTVMTIANAVMTASPITWIVAGITALIAAIILCVVYWDEIKEAVGKAMEAVWNFVKDGVDKVKGFFEGIINWIKDNWQGLLLLIVNPFAGAFKLLYDNCEGFRETINNLVEKIKGFFTGLWDGLKNGATNAWNAVKNTFGSVANWFKDKFSQAWNNVKNIFSTGGKIFTGLKDGIANVFKTIVNGIIGGINKAISVPFNAINGMLNKIRNAEFLGIAPFKGMWKQNPLSVPQIPKLARGGIVDSATIAMIGEQGKEAIVPLENNTEWLDKLASKINGPANGKPLKVILNVDGKAFAETSISTINDLTRQTGSLKLNVM